MNNVSNMWHLDDVKPCYRFYIACFILYYLIFVFDYRNCITLCLALLHTPFTLKKLHHCHSDE